MKQMQKRREPILGFLIGVAYILLCMVPLSNILLSPVPFGQIVLYGLGFYLLFFLLFSVKAGRITAIILLSLSVVVFLFILFNKGPLQEVLLLWMQRLGLAFEKLYYFEPLIGSKYADFHPFIFILLSAVTAFVVWLFKDRHYNFFLLTGYTLLCFMLSYEMAAKEEKISFVLFIILSVASYAGHIYEKRKKSGLEPLSTGRNTTVLRALAIAVLAFLLTLMFPKSDKPLRWDWLDKTVNNVYSRIEEKFTHTGTEFFSLSATGFSDREHLLGGRVRQSNTFVMDVQADKRAYLRGAAYMNYTGTSWLVVDPSFDYNVDGQPESSRDNDELGTVFTYVDPVEPYMSYEDADQMDLMQRFAAGELNDLLFPELIMTVGYRNMVTRTVFSPLKTILPVRKADKSVQVITENSRGILLSDAFLGSGSSYSLSYHQPMYGDDIFQKLLPLSYNGLYNNALKQYVQDWSNIVEAVLDGQADEERLLRIVGPNLVSANGERIDNPDAQLMLSVVRQNVNPTDTPVYQKLSALANTAYDIQRKYTSLPEVVTDRVRALAQDTTEGLESDYEKVIAIRNFLRDSYLYSLSMPRLPEEKEFTDWFLFEQQSGYCTSYATSMAVMLRTLKIPTRYVEGYVLPEKEKDAKSYRVTNRQAHAWVEVYFEGFGWLTFEPTPGFSDTTDFLAQSETELSGIGGSSGMTDLEELMRRYNQNRVEDAGGIFTPIEEAETVPLATRILLFVGSGVFLLMLLSLLIQLGFSVAIQRKPGKKQIVARYLLMLQWLALGGMVLGESESLKAFSKRVDNEYYFPDSSFKNLSEIFERVRYGAKEPNLLELRTMHQLARQLRTQIVKELGLRRFIPLRRLFIGI